MATLRQLKVFVTTAEEKNMSKAAQVLYISQPTISQIISDLEKEYGVILFDRLNKELRITQAGKILLDNAKKIVNIYDNLDQDMKNLHSIRNLRVGATMTIGSNIMAKISKEFETLHPDIKTAAFVTNTAQIEQMLLHNELDVALVEGIIRSKDIISHAAFLDDLCIICSTEHPFASKESISVNDLYQQDFILREKGSGTRDNFEHLMEAHHISYNVRWESTSTSAIVDAVAKNLGIAFLSTRSAAERIKNGQIQICPIKEVNLQRYFLICYLDDHALSSQAKEFINYIKSLPKDFH